MSDNLIFDNMEAKIKNLEAENKKMREALHEAKKQLKNIAGVSITVKSVNISQAEELKEIYRQAKIGYTLIEWALKEEV